MKSLDVNGCPQSNLFFRLMWRKLIKELRIYPTGKVLILGLGGGDLIQLFQIRYPGWKVTVVELEPGVIKIAGDYFGVKESKYLKIVQGDAKKFIRELSTKFDLIIVDIYDGDVIPKWVASYGFIKQVLSKLTTSGRIVFNYASYSFKTVDYDRFARLLSRVAIPYQQQKYFGHQFFILG